MLVEEEHIFDAGEADGLISGQSQAHHRAEAVEDEEVMRDSTGQGEEGSSEDRPEHDRCSTPVRHYGNPKLGVSCEDVRLGALENTRANLQYHCGNVSFSPQISPSLELTA
jgi:hypothetical protein